MSTEYDCEGLRTIRKIFPGIDFDDELEKIKETYPEEACHEFMKIALNRQAIEYRDPMLDEEAPRLDENFSNFFVITNLPKIDPAKKEKLVALIVKLLQKKEIQITPEKIEMPFGDDGKSQGLCFVEVENEARARLAANALNGFPLDKKHTLAACQFDEFSKIMEIPDQLEMPRAADLADLKSPFLDLKKDQYLYQESGKASVHWHDQSQVQSNPAEKKHDAVMPPLQAQKPLQWSPQGTYLIQISHDRVDFLGGSEMQPIITLMEAGVNHVAMSPCERYVLTYDQSSKKEAFIVWNFKLAEKIRAFEKEMFDKADSYKWSYDGSYLAKKFSTEKEDELGQIKKKEGVSVYELPGMNLLEKDGVARSITIPGIESFHWSPAQNVLAYSATPEGGNQLPRVGFMRIPERRVVQEIMQKDAEEFSVLFHPQGDYAAIVIKRREKKQSRYYVDVVDMRDKALPVQHITIAQEVLQFFGVFWEPNATRLAFFANLKKVFEAGKKDYSTDSGKNQVLVFEMVNDANGFLVKNIGNVPSERVKSFAWAGSDGVFSIFEQEGAFQVASIYMITKEDVEGQVQQAARKTKRGQVTLLKGADEKYEFKKTSRFDTKENKIEGHWDPFGRFLAVIGLPKEKRDMNPKTLRFFNVLGEQLKRIDGLKQTSLFAWRPRPQNSVDPKALKALKQDYKKLYNKIFREEERKEKELLAKIEDEKKSKIREEFLNNFFIPGRRAFEKDIEKYEALWPVKAADLEPEEIEIIHTFGQVVSEKKIIN